MTKPFPALVPRVVVLCLLLAVAACSLPNANNPSQPISGPPVVRIVSPLPNATYMESVSVPIQVSVSNAGADIDRVEFKVDNAIVATFPAPNPTAAATFSLTQSWPIAGVGVHHIDVTAFRKDGSASQPATVEVSVISASGQTQPTPITIPGGGQPTTTTDGGNTAPTQPPAQQQPTQPPQQQPTTAPTQPPPPPSPTSNKPTATFIKGANIRLGPGTMFPVVASIAPNQTADIVAVNPAGDWYKIVSANGSGWVFAQLVTATGDLANVPQDAGPPTPAPTNTPLPTVPPSLVDLVIDSVAISPHPLVCQQTSTINVTIHNAGSGPASAGGLIDIQDIVVSSGEKGADTQTAFPALAPGQSFTGQAKLTVSTHTNEGHRLIITVDSSNQVPESNENNNQYSNNPPTDFVLGKGSCP